MSGGSCGGGGGGGVMAVSGVEFGGGGGADVRAHDNERGYISGYNVVGATTNGATIATIFHFPSLFSSAGIMLWAL